MPIYESNVALHAYELVSQPRDEGSPHPPSAELDALRDELGTFSEVGLDQIVGNHQAFVDVSHDAVMAGYCLSLSKQRVVLEVLDDIVSDPAFKDELRKLSDAGVQDRGPKHDTKVLEWKQSLGCGHRPGQCS